MNLQKWFRIGLKRSLDISLSGFALIFLSPLVLILSLAIWLQDRHSPLYVADRVGINGKTFRMFKFRSMVINADLAEVDSTSNNDQRITGIGHLVRKFKLDEIPQLWNVLKGEMSLVGPRPNVKRESDLYTTEERKLLSVKPGITDISSIVFSDEGDILKDYSDPDLAYNQLIRPGKSSLGLVYVNNSRASLDFYLIFLTLLSQVNRKLALERLSELMVSLNAPQSLVDLCLRNKPLKPSPPPGSNKIVESRNLEA